MTHTDPFTATCSEASCGGQIILQPAERTEGVLATRGWQFTYFGRGRGHSYHCPACVKAGKAPCPSCHALPNEPHHAKCPQLK